MNITALLAGLLSGIIGSMGLGGGTVLIIYLSLFTSHSQLESQGINLLFFIPCAVIAIIIYLKGGLIKLKNIVKIAVFGIIGAFLGLYLSNILKEALIAKLFGVLLIILAFNELFNNVIKRLAERIKKWYTKNE